MRRRRLLATIGSGAVALQAGCLAGGPGDATPTETDDGTPPNGTDEPTPEPTETDVEPTVVDHSIETTRAECMSDGDEEGVDVEFRADGVTIDGLLSASNPCHEATVESASVDSGALRVGIGLESTDEACVECVGVVEYSATIDLDGAAGLDAVTVDHGDSGGSYTVTRDR